MLNRRKHTSWVSALLTGCVIAGAMPAAAHAATRPSEDAGALVRELSPVLGVAIAAPVKEQRAAVQGNLVAAEGESASVPVLLPVSTEPEVEVQGGLIALSDSSDYSVVPVFFEDGSVAIHTVIDNENAPRSYDYDFTSERGTQVVLSDEAGGATVLDASGAPVAYVAAPWAKDANGASLPTTYTADGGILTQHVQFDSTTAFPVVADPWLGVELVANYSWTAENGGYRLNVDPTPWARGGTGNVAWVAMGEAGWDELRNKMPYAYEKNRLNESGKQQYICHMGFAGADPQWNMELYKPNRGLAGFIANKCN